MRSKTVRLLYGKQGCEIRVPDSADVLEGQNIPAVPDARAAVENGLAHPSGARPLRELLAERNPATVAVTISDITRPVPNRQFLPSLLATLNTAGVGDERIVIIIGTGMHRPSTTDEREILIGADIARRVEVIDHTADRPDTLVQVTDGNDGHRPASVNRRFVEAHFRIVTGYIEPHFMAGFSGGRKGVCPALADLTTIQHFHGYRTLADPAADTGILTGNPCHAESLRVARAVGVDFLLNVAITRDRQIAAVYCGDMEQAHEAGCRQVSEWTQAVVQEPYDLVVTNGGGYPLDQTFYQTVKGQVTALAALLAGGVLLQISECSEGIGSSVYRDILLRWGKDWRGFLDHIAASPATELDQWELQMQCRALRHVGIDGLRLVTDGVDAEVQSRIALTPVLGPDTAPIRLQQAVDAYLAVHAGARIAVIPDGPYTMLRAGS